MTPPLFLVSGDALAADPVVVDGPEGRHAADVRRLRAGEVVCLTDGAGGIVDGVVADVTRGVVTVAVSARRSEPAGQPRFVVIQALAKGGRDTDAVEAMTEVGVDEVLGWESARTVARWTDRVGERWDATARAAAKQARRAWVPVTGGPASTADVAARLRGAGLAVVLHESADVPVTSLPVPATGEVVVVVGPEGGIDGAELAAFGAAGAHICRLGSSVLRTSTAGVAALSVLSAATRWR